jgi:hypothetical protein
MLDDATDVSHLTIRPLENTTYRCGNCKFWEVLIEGPKGTVDLGYCEEPENKESMGDPDQSSEFTTFKNFGCIKFQPISCR